MPIEKSCMKPCYTYKGGTLGKGICPTIEILCMHLLGITIIGMPPTHWVLSKQTLIHTHTHTHTKTHTYTHAHTGPPLRGAPPQRHRSCSGREGAGGDGEDHAGGQQLSTYADQDHQSGGQPHQLIFLHVAHFGMSKNSCTGINFLIQNFQLQCYQNVLTWAERLDSKRDPHRTMLATTD